MFPDRRDVLGLVVGTLPLAALPGCLSGTDDSDSSPTATDRPASATVSPTPTASDTPTASTTPDTLTASTPTDTPSAAGRIMVALHNHRDAAVTLSLRVTGGAETLLETERALEAGGYEAVPSGIRAVGEYELRVETNDGVAASRTYAIGKYDVRTGSNLVVWVEPDDVELAIEE